jgi:hypothetical protein
MVFGYLFIAFASFIIAQSWKETVSELAYAIISLSLMVGGDVLFYLGILRPQIARCYDEKIK